MLRLKSLELNGFKSFARKSEFLFDRPIVAIVGPNGSGKSNIVESIRFVLGEQSIKSLRGKTGSDLIFKGSSYIPKASRASTTICFSNEDRIFSLNSIRGESLSLDFDEIRIRREVYADGGNRYFINDHEVRMRDIHDLISSIHIGASGHHIISQGEADRYLNANARERKKLIEEALGLKRYQIRIRDARRKLEKANNNLREVELLRKEIQPQLRFLRKQMEHIERMRAFKGKLYTLLNHFLFWESEDISRQKTFLYEKKKEIQKAIKEREEFLEKLSERKQEQDKLLPEEEEIEIKQKYIQSWQKKIRENELERGRVEGMIRFLQERETEKSQKKEKREEKMIPFALLKNFLRSLLDELEEKKEREHFLRHLKQRVNTFLQSFQKEGEGDTEERNNETKNAEENEELQRKREILIQANREAEQYIKELEREIIQLSEKIRTSRLEREKEQQSFYQIQLELGKLKTQLGELNTETQRIAEREQNLQGIRDELRALEQSLGEGERAEKPHIAISSFTQFHQERRRMLHEIERMRIRLEEFGGGDEDAFLTELNELQERDHFLESEAKDIQETIENLQSLIKQLEATIEEQFAKGVALINREFQNFFRLMFGGGDASLSVIAQKKRKNEEEGEEEKEELGVEVRVKIPRKRVSDLNMLSGGERSLTSIALLFALSQVNPPPFLILDETDAALDEENSRRYGDMVERLAEKSQLILVTHNRETMSRAHSLFGVTLGRDAASQVFSIRLQDATQYAK